MPQNQPQEMEKAIAASKSFVGPALAVLVLYWFCYIPGLIFNLMWFNEANRIRKVTGRDPAGMGCLTIMLFAGFIPLVVFLVLCIGPFVGVGVASLGLATSAPRPIPAATAPVVAPTPLQAAVASPTPTDESTDDSAFTTLNATTSADGKVLYVRILIETVDPREVMAYHARTYRSLAKDTPLQNVFIHYVDNADVEPWLSPGGAYENTGPRTLGNGRTVNPTADEVNARVRYKITRSGRDLWYNDWGFVVAKAAGVTYSSNLIQLIKDDGTPIQENVDAVRRGLIALGQVEE